MEPPTCIKSLFKDVLTIQRKAEEICDIIAARLFEAIDWSESMITKFENEMLQLNIVTDQFDASFLSLVDPAILEELFGDFTEMHMTPMFIPYIFEAPVFVHSLNVNSAVGKAHPSNDYYLKMYYKFIENVKDHLTKFVNKTAGTHLNDASIALENIECQFNINSFPYTVSMVC